MEESIVNAIWQLHGGKMATDGGHAPLTETVSVLDILSMTTKSFFMSTEKAINEWWSDSLQKSMNEAVKEEIQKALERGFFHEGIYLLQLNTPTMLTLEQE